VLLLLQDPSKWQDISDNGRLFVLKNFSLQSVVKKIEQSYKSVL